MEECLPVGQADAVLAWLENPIEEGHDEALGTGAIEPFVDSGAARRRVRDRLGGREWAVLEQCRVFRGQPDYGDAQ